jgi:hypothetical protein
MSTRWRLRAYGPAALLVLVGGVCAAVSGSTTGQIVGYTIGTLGLGAIVLLVFYEIGLSEDRDRAEEERRRRGRRY